MVVYSRNNVFSMKYSILIGISISTSDVAHTIDICLYTVLLNYVISFVLQVMKEIIMMDN